MAWLHDASEEFKKLPNGGKIAVVGIFVLVAGIGLYSYYKSRTSGTNALGSAANASPSTDLTGASGFPTVPGPTGNQVPVLPSGLVPIFDSLGNLVGWQPAPTGSTPTPTPTPSFQWPGGLTGQEIWQGTTTKNFFFGPKGPQPGRQGQTALSTLFPSGTTFTQGPNNTFFYTLPGGTQQQAPVNLVNPNPPKKGGGSLTHGIGGGTQVRFTPEKRIVQKYTVVHGRMIPIRVAV